MKTHHISFFTPLYLIELCIIFFAMIPLFTPLRTYNYQTADLSRKESNLENVSYIIDTPVETLKRGSYEITLEYQTEADSVTFCATSFYGSSMATDDIQNVPLSSGMTKYSFPLTTSSTIQGFHLEFSVPEDASLQLHNIKIAENNMLKRSTFVTVFILCISINILLFFYRKFWIKADRSSKIIIFALALLCVILSIPALDIYAVTGHDLEFHLVRIEELKSNLLNLQFPSRIQGGWLNKAGYAVSVFYGDLFLYFPAFLRLCGFSISISYNCYIILFNIVTILFSYYCFSNIFKNRYLGLLGSMLYSGSYYRMTNIYVRSAVGEFTAITFFPLIALGLYRIFTDNPKSKNYKYNWILPALGYSGLIQSHILSCEIAGFITVVTCLILIKRTLQPKRFITLLKTVLATLLINAGFLIPFLDYMRGDYRFNDKSLNHMIQSKGVFLTDLFIPFPHIGGRATTAADRLYSATPMPVSIGLAFTGILVLIAFLLLCSRPPKKEPLWKYTCFCTIITVLTLWMTTCLFPWDALYQAHALLAILIKSIQFPWRLLGVVMLFISMSSGSVIILIKKQFSYTHAKYAFVLLAMCSLMSLAWFISNLHDNIYYTDYNSNTLSHTLIGKGEYLPQGTDKEALLTFSGDFPDNVEISELIHEAGLISLSCINTSDAPQNIEVPLLYYPYYEAYDIKSKSRFDIEQGNNKFIQITIPSNYSGTLEVSFREPIHWRLSELISLISILVLLWIKYKKTTNLSS